MRYSIKYTNNTQGKLTSYCICLVESDDYFKVMCLSTTGVMATPAVTSQEDGTYISVFVFGRYERVHVLYEARDFTCTLRLDGLTPVVESKTDDAQVDIQEAVFPFTLGYQVSSENA